MSVRIRLRRVGKRNAPAHRIVVVDQRAPRDGKFIENLGTYNPRAKAESVDLERVDHWVSKGAQMSETVAAIVKRAKAGISWSGNQTAHHRKPADTNGTPPAEGEEAGEDDQTQAASPEAETPAKAEDDQTQAASPEAETPAKAEASAKENEESAEDSASGSETDASKSE